MASFYRWETVTQKSKEFAQGQTGTNDRSQNHYRSVCPQSHALSPISYCPLGLSLCPHGALSISDQIVRAKPPYYSLLSLLWLWSWWWHWGHHVFVHLDTTKGTCHRHIHDFLSEVYTLSQFSQKYFYKVKGLKEKPEKCVWHSSEPKFLQISFV